MSIGFRIARRQRVVDRSWVEAFSGLPVSNVSDVMSRMSGGGPRLLPLRAAWRLAGPALTVRTRPGDNLMVHKAIDLAVPGDIVVVDAGGETANAIIGELMVAHAARRGVAGFVIDGAVRDSRVLREGSLPVFAAGITHRGPFKDGPGEINGPIAIGGMVVEAGDLILGDDDGVLCVPYADVAMIHRAAAAKHAAEEQQLIAIGDGRNDRSWVDEALRRLGCELDLN